MRYLCVILCAVVAIVNGQDCSDRVDFCDNIVGFKTCDLYLSKVNCRKSCNLCNEPMPEPQPTDPSCTDEHPYCEQSFYICRQYPEFEGQCRRTCGLCKPGGGSSTKSPVVVTNRPPTRQPEVRPTGTTLNCRNVRNQRFTPDTRNLMLEGHNELRSLLAQGKVQDSKRLLRSGKNIYELSWDCELEERAQNWADRCQYGHSTSQYRNGAGESIYKWSKSDKFDRTDTSVVRSIGMWWNEIKKIDLSYNTDNLMDNYVLGTAGHWSQMAWGATTKIGCGVRNCTEGSSYTTHLVCHYSVAGNEFNKPIYELGNGCSRDSDCTTYQNSKCDTSTKLCIKP